MGVSASDSSLACRLSQMDNEIDALLLAFTGAAMMGSTLLDEPPEKVSSNGRRQEAHCFQEIPLLRSNSCWYSHPSLRPLTAAVPVLPPSS